VTSVLNLCKKLEYAKFFADTFDLNVIISIT
jgi:hypothetical protein